MQVSHGIAAFPRLGIMALWVGFDGGNAHLSSLRPGRITLLEPVVKLSTVMGDVHLDLIGTTFAHHRRRCIPRAVV